MAASATLLPQVGAGPALAAGASVGLLLGNPYPLRSSRVAKWLLKASVVGLGFGMSLPAVLDTGRNGFSITAVAMACTLALGWGLGRVLNVERITATLISGGTAICGGSAIAALGPALGASPNAMSVALGTVFLLNGLALYIFPLVGHALDLSQTQFAIWSAIAIHDTSSVVGAATSYGPDALAQATVLKLTRALWIVPVATAAAWWRRRTNKESHDAPIPWFIGLFVVASAMRGVWPGGELLYDVLLFAARRGLVLTLFLIGAGMTRSTLRSVGGRPVAHGTILWTLVVVGSLAAIATWVN